MLRVCWLLWIGQGVVVTAFETLYPSARTIRRPSLIAPRTANAAASLCSLGLSSKCSNDGRKRKRDIIRNWGSGIKNSKLMLPLRPLRGNSGDDDNDDANNIEESSSAPSISDPVKDKLDSTWMAVKEKIDMFVSHIPKPVLEFLQAVVEKLQSLQLLLGGFVVGALVACAAIFVPIYSSVETLSQPVTLFETILGDLEQAYVDEIDPQKLFETGVSAMLRSLDPYTEFESKQAAADLSESIDGRYAGVGLVIAGSTTKNDQPNTVNSKSENNKLLPNAAQDDAIKLQDGDISSSTSGAATTASPTLMEDEDDEDLEYRRELEKARKQGIRVVSAFEGYAFDYGLRVGDKLLAIDDQPITQDTSVEQVRNTLRGEPGTVVAISFERDGVDGVQSVTIPRSVVRIRDVKLATLLGRPEDGIGYIQLNGFASETGREMRSAIRFLQQAAEDASSGERSLQGLVLDLRGNPGGLLTSAVDVASLLVPKGSDIVSAKGRGFPGILYRSRVEPILDANTKLAVLVNGGTASAAEIVAGAVQDLDVGVIIGSDRTFGKGLVQNVEDLPFNTALKFTVAKYYTPSGRCIQGINYKEGGGLGEQDGKYVASKVADKDRSVFYTKSGRMVKDGGGIEADYKVEAPKASALEVTLLRSGVFGEFAADWSKKNELTNNFDVDEDTYKSFQAFVNQKQRNGELQLEGLYDKSLSDLKKALKKSGYKGSEKVVEQLQASIVREAQKDFERYRSDIKEDISQSILARYLPESMLIERGVKSDKQVSAAIKLIASDNKFERLLAKGSTLEGTDAVSSSLNVARTPDKETKAIRSSMSW